MTEADLVTIAGLSRDFNPIHTVEEHARSSVFRGPIAHGLLIQSIASALAMRADVFDGTVVAVLEMQIAFRNPVRPGDTLRIELAVLGKQPDPAKRRGWVLFGTSGTNQSGETVIERS